MNKVSNFAIYQLSAFGRGAMGYYLVILGLALLTLFDANSQVEFNGGTAILVFVLGLNCFKTSFLFSQANNLSRRFFYLSTALAIFALGFTAATIDFTLSGILTTLSNDRVLFDGVFSALYPQASLLKIPWLTMANLVWASAGWMITMLYYRSSTPWKVGISLIPLAAIWGVTHFNKLSEGRLWTWIFSSAIKALGLAGEAPNPLVAIFSFTVLTLLILAVNFVLMVRMPVKIGS